MRPSQLELQPERRAGETLDSGATRAERAFLDFRVDGVSLWELCQHEGIDNISCLWLPNADAAAVRRLLLRGPADAPSGKVTLYVCAECGDLGCGAVTVRISREGDVITWHDFTYQNNYDPATTFTPESFTAIDPVSFATDDYERLLLPLLDEAT